MRRVRVYVAGPISAPTHRERLFNIQRGLAFGATLVELGYAPFVPHLDAFLFPIEDELTWQQALKMDLAWLEVADCLFRLPNSESSRGVRIEVEFCRDKGIPIVEGFSELYDLRRALALRGQLDTTTKEVEA